MVTIRKMGRRKLGRVKRNITLPSDLAEKADDLAAAEGRPLGHLIEEHIRPYVLKRWAESMRAPTSPPKPGRPRRPSR